MPSKDDSPDITRAIGQRIADLRAKRGLKQSDLARLLDISQTSVSKYELGEVRLTASAIIKLSKALKVSTDELLGVKKP